MAPVDTHTCVQRERKGMNQKTGRSIGEEAEVGLDQINNDWQERMERKKGKNKG